MRPHFDRIHGLIQRQREIFADGVARDADLLLPLAHHGLVKLEVSARVELAYAELQSAA